MNKTGTSHRGMGSVTHPRFFFYKNRVKSEAFIWDRAFIEKFDLKNNLYKGDNIHPTVLKIKSTGICD